MARITIETNDGMELLDVELSGKDWNLDSRMQRIYLSEYLMGEIIPGLRNAFEREEETP